ncbi:hypothetical protein VWT76_16045 [Xanthomonas citri pv. citri]|uniref:hypothetical protein n=1 Tax=Xanthomonas citri TaxID=346 RepID=UPI000950EBF6|nr:hypothetical protein [Xanthomonas citri]MBD5035005.1 hypothetical protein [Xanthomonas citri pv. citri]MBD5054711.1 hypothetical protein [Xanthomonas citri pv. citri]OLR69735.1 hypothetical protein BI311_23780 [Xanthomonas citri pv. citri]
MDAKKLLDQLQRNEISAIRDLIDPPWAQVQRQVAMNNATLAQTDIFANATSDRIRIDALVKQFMRQDLNVPVGDAWLTNLTTRASMVAAGIFRSDRQLSGLVVDRAEFLRSIQLPDAQLAAFIAAARDPTVSIQQSLSRMFETSAFVSVGSDEEGASQLEAQDTARVGLSDAVTATVYTPINPDESGWWASLTPELRFTIIIAAITFLMQLPGTIKDARDLLVADNNPTKVQIQTLIDVSRSSLRTLERLADLEQKTAKLHEDSVRNQDLIAASLQSYSTDSVGHPCRIVSETSVRERGPEGRVKRRASAGQLGICLEHRGRWLEIAYDAPTGVIEGWVLKKHTQWD